MESDLIKRVWFVLIFVSCFFQLLNLLENMKISPRKGIYRITDTNQDIILSFDNESLVLFFSLDQEYFRNIALKFEHLTKLFTTMMIGK